jgi:hypothetical protein
MNTLSSLDSFQIISHVFVIYGQYIHVKKLTIFIIKLLKTQKHKIKSNFTFGLAFINMIAPFNEKNITCGNIVSNEMKFFCFLVLQNVTCDLQTTTCKIVTQIHIVHHVDACEVRRGEYNTILPIP